MGNQKIKQALLYLFLAALVFMIVGCDSPDGMSTPSNIQSIAVSSPTDDIQATPENTASYVTNGQETDPSPENSEAAPEPSADPTDSQGYCSFLYKDTNRKYILYIPENIPGNAPLVFMLHGYSSNAKDFEALSQMNDAADQNHFAVVYPQGLEVNDAYYNKPSWNAGFTFTDVDDTGFLVALAGYLQDKYGFSREMTFAAGFSNGGFMCYKLAVSAPETFKAVASVSGTMSGEVWEERDTSDTAVSILEIHGTGDTRIPIDGSLSEQGGWGGAPELAQVIEYWRNRYQLYNSETFEIPPNTTAYQYSGDLNHCLVWYYEIEGYGHRWPSFDDAGFNAKDIIWDFFSNFIE